LIDQVIQALALKAPDTVVVSGGAKGVDTWAVESAQKYGLKVEVYPADWEKHGKGAGFIRNTQIVEGSDSVLAFWDLISRGTMDTVRKAQTQGKKVRVLDPIGNTVVVPLR